VLFGMLGPMARRGTDSTGVALYGPAVDGEYVVRARVDTDHGTAEGVLEMHPKGYGFLRNPAKFYAAQPLDAYVPAPLVQKFDLREGNLISGPVAAPFKGSGPRVLDVELIEGVTPDKFVHRDFDALTAIDHMVTYCRVVDIAARRRQSLRAE